MTKILSKQLCYVLGIYSFTILSSMAGINLSSSKTMICSGQTVTISADTDCEAGGISVSVSLSNITGDQYYSISGDVTFVAPGDVTVTAEDLCGNTKSITITVLPPSCDNPASVSDTIVECYHLSTDTNGAPCGSSFNGGIGVIEDYLATQSCSWEGGSPCAGRCNLKDGPFPELIQQVYTASSCVSAATINKTVWHTILSGCTDCESIPYQVACVASNYTEIAFDHQRPINFAQVACQ